MLPWHSFQLMVWKSITNVIFQAFLFKLPSQNINKLETLMRRHTVDSCLACSGLMTNGVCQLFLKFAYWVTAFWICRPGYTISAFVYLGICTYRHPTRLRHRHQFLHMIRVNRSVSLHDENRGNKSSVRDSVEKNVVCRIYALVLLYILLKDIIVYIAVP